METAASSIETLFKRLEEYGRTTCQVTKLKILEITIKTLTSIIARTGVLLILLIFLVILLIGIALMLGEWLGKSYYGFFIVAVFCLATGLLLYFFLHKWIRKPVSKYIISKTLQS